MKKIVVFLLAMAMISCCALAEELPYSQQLSQGWLCPVCGRVNDPSYNFCPDCATPRSSAQESSSGTSGILSLDDIVLSLTFLSNAELDTVINSIISEQAERSASEPAGGVDYGPDDSYLSDDMLIGSWSPDNQADNPLTLEFYYDENGVLCFYYYRRFLYEIDYGHAYTTIHQAICDCYPVYVDDIEARDEGMEFLISEINEGRLINREDGQVFYKVSDRRLSVAPSDGEQGGGSWSFDVPEGWYRAGGRSPLISDEQWDIYCPEGELLSTSEGHRIETRFVSIENMDYRKSDTRMANDAYEMIEARFEKLLGNNTGYTAAETMRGCKLRTEVGREYYMLFLSDDQPYYFFVPCEGGFLEMHVDLQYDYTFENTYDAAMSIINSLSRR